MIVMNVIYIFQKNVLKIFVIKISLSSKSSILSRNKPQEKGGHKIPRDREENIKIEDIA